MHLCACHIHHSANGDYVPDTPAEAYPDYVCESQRDSCGDGGRADDVTNYMNYGAFVG